MALVEKNGYETLLTDEGQQIVKDAVEQWADTTWTVTAADTQMSAGKSETTTHAQSIDPEIPATELSRHDQM